MRHLAWVIAAAPALLAACAGTVEPTIQRVAGTYILVSINSVKIPGAVTSACCVPIQVYAGTLTVTDSTWHAEACLDAACTPSLRWVREGYVDGLDAVGPVRQRTAQAPMVFADFADGGIIYPDYSGGRLTMSIPYLTNYFSGQAMVFQQQ